MSTTIPLTIKGAQKLKAELHRLKTKDRPDVIAAIASGSLDIGYVGSSPLAAAASRELPIETIAIVGLFHLVLTSTEEAMVTVLRLSTLMLLGAAVTATTTVSAFIETIARAFPPYRRRSASLPQQRSVAWSCSMSSASAISPWAPALAFKRRLSARWPSSRATC